MEVPNADGAFCITGNKQLIGSALTEGHCCHCLRAILKRLQPPSTLTLPHSHPPTDVTSSNVVTSPANTHTHEGSMLPLPSSQLQHIARGICIPNAHHAIKGA